MRSMTPGGSTVLVDARLLAGVDWCKASFSESRGMCVEAGAYLGGVAVRHSVTPENGALVYTREEFAAFLDGAKRGEFDHLV